MEGKNTVTWHGARTRLNKQRARTGPLLSTPEFIPYVGFIACSQRWLETLSIASGASSNPAHCQKQAASRNTSPM